MSYRYSPQIVKDRAHLFEPLQRGEMCVWSPSEQDLMHTQFRLRETLANARNYPNVVPWLTEWARKIRLVIDGGRIITEPVGNNRIKPARAVAGAQPGIAPPVGVPVSVVRGSATPVSELNFDTTAEEVVSRAQSWLSSIYDGKPDTEILSMVNARTTPEELLKAVTALESSGLGVYAVHPYKTPLNAGWIITTLGDPERLPFDAEYVENAAYLAKQDEPSSGFDLLKGDQHD